MQIFEKEPKFLLATRVRKCIIETVNFFQIKVKIQNHFIKKLLSVLTSSANDKIQDTRCFFRSIRIAIVFAVGFSSVEKLVCNHYNCDNSPP